MRLRRRLTRGSHALYRPSGLIAALLAVVLASTLAWRASADNGLPAPGWAVTAQPLTSLLDGQVVTVNIKANADVAINQINVRECRLGAPYRNGNVTDTNPGTGNCPNSPVSSSGDLVQQRSASDGSVGAARSSSGLSLMFHVGTGTASWDAAPGPETLTCGPPASTTDVSHPCALVAQITVGPDVVYQTWQLTFTDADPIKACGGAASGFIKAEASDELADTWSGWTRDVCIKAGGGGAPTNTSFTGEGTALTDFVGGTADLAYGDAGADPSSGMIQGAGTRNAIAIPVALNAAVVSVAGGGSGGIGQPLIPYQQLQLTVADAAGVLAGGLSALQDPSLPYSADILATNSTLAGIDFWNGGGVTVQGPSLPLTSSWTLTNFFKAQAPGDWVNRWAVTTPNPRGVTADLATADPPFHFLGTYTGLPSLKKITAAQAQSGIPGPLWVYADNATAQSLGLTPVRLQTAVGSSNYVAPDAASMAAAVPLMKTDSKCKDPTVAGSCVLLPNVQPTGSARTQARTTTSATPYPLTYVVYAFAPAEPLLDSNCATRDTSQTLLTSWLKYITGPGQSNLPSGLAPLPASLASQAAAAIPKVGTAPVTGTCAGQVSTPGVASSATNSGMPLGGGASAATVPSAIPKAVAAAAAARPLTIAPPNKAGQPIVTIPIFAGHTIPDPWGGVVALIGIILVMSLAAWITAGGHLSGGRLWAPGSLGALTPRRVASLGMLWLSTGIVGVGLVLFQLGPLFEQRDQHALLSQYRRQVSVAANETSGLAGVTVPTRAPEFGSPIGILEIGALRSQDVVVEGAQAVDTKHGPGHVPGTAGLGQGGNAVIVGRRNGYGGAFQGLATLRKGDRILVTTTQGQTVYSVKSVKNEDITGLGSGTAPASSGSGTPSTPSSTTPSSTATTPTSSGTAATTPTTSGTSATTAPNGSTTTTVAPTTPTTAPYRTTAKVTANSTPSTTAATTATTSAKTATTGVHAGTYTPARHSRGSSGITLDSLYGPTTDDRLTLVTSASKVPWNSSRATIVTARMLTKAFQATPQNGRSAAQTGNHGDSGIWSTIILIFMAFIGVIIASVALYRKMQFRVAYMLSIAPLVALTVIAGETLARLLPAWT